MFDGADFRSESLEAADKIETFRTGDPVAASRARKWADRGADLIDDQDGERATRYLLALIGSLSDQNAINTQATIGVWARRILLPLWIITVTLAWMVIRPPSF